MSQYTYNKEDFERVMRSAKEMQQFFTIVEYVCKQYRDKLTKAEELEETRLRS